MSRTVIDERRFRPCAHLVVRLASALSSIEFNVTPILCSSFFSSDFISEPPPQLLYLGRQRFDPLQVAGSFIDSKETL